jgi:hypothetical protein
MKRQKARTILGSGLLPFHIFTVFASVFLTLALALTLAKRSAHELFEELAALAERALAGGE